MEYWVQSAGIFMKRNWIWILCLVAAAACSACRFHSHRSFEAFAFEQQLVERTPILPESMLYKHFFSIQHDLQRQAFFSLSPMYQFMVVRDSLLHRNAHYQEYMLWFSTNDEDVIEETCSLMLLTDFSYWSYCVAYGYLVSNDVLDGLLRDDDHEYIAIGLLAMYSLFSTLDAKQTDRLFSTFASLSDQRTLFSLFEHMAYMQVVTRTITEDPFLVHQRAYVALLQHFYGVAVPLPEGSRFDTRMP